MPRFIHLEENDDGTTTVTTNVGGEEMTFLFQIDFDGMAEMITGPALEEAAEMVTETVIHIPNRPEG